MRLEGGGGMEGAATGGAGAGVVSGTEREKDGTELEGNEAEALGVVCSSCSSSQIDFTDIFGASSVMTTGGVGDAANRSVDDAAGGAVFVSLVVTLPLRSRLFSNSMSFGRVGCSLSSSSWRGGPRRGGAEEDQPKKAGSHNGLRRQKKMTEAITMERPKSAMMGGGSGKFATAWRESASRDVNGQALRTHLLETGKLGVGRGWCGTTRTPGAEDFGSKPVAVSLPQTGHPSHGRQTSTEHLIITVDLVRMKVGDVLSRFVSFRGTPSR
jgi:hypothetical protein